MPTELLMFSCYVCLVYLNQPYSRFLIGFPCIISKRYFYLFRAIARKIVPMVSLPSTICNKMFGWSNNYKISPDGIREMIRVQINGNIQRQISSKLLSIISSVRYTWSTSKQTGNVPLRGKVSAQMGKFGPARWTKKVCVVIFISLLQQFSFIWEDWPFFHTSFDTCNIITSLILCIECNAFYYIVGFTLPITGQKSIFSLEDLMAILVHLP